MSQSHKVLVSVYVLYSVCKMYTLTLLLTCIKYLLLCMFWAIVGNGTACAHKQAFKK